MSVFAAFAIILWLLFLPVYALFAVVLASVSGKYAWGAWRRSKREHG